MGWQALASQPRPIDDASELRDAVGTAYATLAGRAAAGTTTSDADWAALVESTGILDQVADLINDGLVAVSLSLGVRLDDRTLAATTDEFATSILDGIVWIRNSIDQYRARDPQTLDWTGPGSPLSPVRAQRYADALANGAVNAGYQAGLNLAPNPAQFAATPPTPQPVAAIRWVTMRDERVRPAHEAADQDTILLGEEFSIGGHPARYPGDPRLPIGLRINCRCILAWVDGSQVRRIAGASRRDLYAQAQRLDISGRSKMTKAQLQSALLEELCLQGLAGGPDCPDVFDQMNRSALMVHAKDEKIVGRWRMTKPELVEALRSTIRGGDRIRVAQGYTIHSEFTAAQSQAAAKRRLAAQFPPGQPPPVVPNTRTRRSARQGLFDEFGGTDRGHVPCVFCGLKLNPNPTAGLAVLVPTPIRPFAQGGTAALANMLPACSACFQAHSTAQAAAALVASGGNPGERFDGDDVEMPDWVRRRSEKRLRRFLADAKLHLAGTEYDHDQSTHGGGGRTLAEMSRDERIAALTDAYGTFSYEYQGDTFRAAGRTPEGAVNPERFPPVRVRTLGERTLIQGLIVDGDGEPIGEFVREVFPDGDPPSVYNDTLSMDEEYQNRGIGSAFLDQTEQALARLGIEQVQVTAVAVGKYAWAARGYRLDTEGLGDFGSPDSYAARRIEGWAEEVDRVRINLTDEEAAAADAVLAAWRANPADVIPADLLVVSPTKMKTVFRNGPDWDGVRDIRPREPAIAASGAPTMMPTIDFHLQGRHDQKTHGNRASVSGAREIRDTPADLAWEHREGNPRLSGEGDCYPTAFHTVHDLLDDPNIDQYRIVHGVVSGQGDLDGVRFDHAWVERTTRMIDEMPADILDQLSPEQRAGMEQAEFTTVIDRSNGNDVEIPAGLYYNIGEINPGTVRRYTVDQAMREAVRTGHYGPWEDQ